MSKAIELLLKIWELIFWGFPATPKVQTHFYTYNFVDIALNNGKYIKHVLFSIALLSYNSISLFVPPD